jgi:hypothetical protein
LDVIPRYRKLKIKREENALSFAKQQISKHWPTAVVNAGNLAIKDGAIRLSVFSNPVGKLGKT